MTRKQLFEMMATAMHEAKPAAGVATNAQWALCCFKIAEQLAMHNSTFDSKRFYLDCVNGPKQET